MIESLFKFIGKRFMTHMHRKHIHKHIPQYTKPNKRKKTRVNNNANKTEHKKSKKLVIPTEPYSYSYPEDKGKTRKFQGGFVQIVPIFWPPAQVNNMCMTETNDDQDSDN